MTASPQSFSVYSFLWWCIIFLMEEVPLLFALCILDLILQPYKAVYYLWCLGLLPRSFWDFVACKDLNM